MFSYKTIIELVGQREQRDDGRGCFGSEVKKSCRWQGMKCLEKDIS